LGVLVRVLLGERAPEAEDLVAKVRPADLILLHPARERGLFLLMIE